MYPLTIHPHQEEGLRKAAKEIEQLAKNFEKNYAVRDKQDVLAMCALHFASKLEQQQIDEDDMSVQTQKRLKALHVLLDEALD